MKKHSKRILCQNNFEEKEKLCFEKKGEFIIFSIKMFEHAKS